MKKGVIQAIIVSAILVGAMFWFFTQLPLLNALTCTVPGSHATIQIAVNDLACDEIKVAAGTYLENVTINNREVIITGAGVDSTIVDGNAVGRVFTIQANSIVTLTEMSITNGMAADGGGVRVDNSDSWLENVRIVENKADSTFGGGISNIDGEVHLSYSEVLSNTAETYGGGLYNNNTGGTAVLSSTIRANRAVHLMMAQGYGGGAANFGVLIIQNSAIDNNLAHYTGGGVYSGSGTLSIVTSSIDNNIVQAATSSGGGVYNLADAIIDQSAIHSNIALADAGGIRNAGDLQLFNTTLSNNSANGAGGLQNNGNAALANNTITANNSALVHIGGILASGGTISMANNIIVDHGSANDCKATSGTINSSGHNLDSDNSCYLVAAGDLPNENPLLGPLQNNGGPTLTHALLPGSPAIDSGSSTHCPSIDQRGWSRDSLCDIGSYERGYDLHLPLILKEN
ncbi:MAG: hypothetical protein GY805_03300 [Chloroflexi bacterium]|nr:hypothetical protein [Chloroflexota bacterium]